MYLKKKSICIPSMTSGDESQTFVIQVSLYVLPAYVILSTFLCGWSFLSCILNTNPLLSPLQIPSEAMLVFSPDLWCLSLLQKSSGLPALPASFIDCLSCAGHWTILFNHCSHPVWGGDTVIPGALRLRREGASPGDTGRERAGNQGQLLFLQSQAFKSCIT